MPENETWIFFEREKITSREITAATEDNQQPEITPKEKISIYTCRLFNAEWKQSNNFNFVEPVSLKQGNYKRTTQSEARIKNTISIDNDELQQSDGFDTGNS